MTLLPSTTNSGFVRRKGPHFILGDQPFVPTGTNNYYQMTYRRWQAPGPDEVLDHMQRRGMNLLRTWAFQDAAECGAALLAAPERQLAPGERPLDFIDPQTLVALDQTLAAADARGIRVILTLVNNWADYGGIDRWTLWRFGAVRHDAFFSDPTIRAWYRELAALLINRVNSVNGRVYGDDPTIFAWELANEPRCSSGAAPHLDAWIAEMSDHIKSLDSNHLVTTGIEGFYSSADAERNTNGWMTACGQDFIRNHQHPSIDFATCHIWPQNWNWNPLSELDRALRLAGNPLPSIAAKSSLDDPRSALTKSRHYLQQRLMDAHSVLGKPLLCEEFGIPRDNMGRGVGSGPTTVRDLFLQQLHADVTEANARIGGACCGLLTWHILHDGYAEYDDGNGIFLPSDSNTDALITAASGSMARFTT